MSSDLTIRLGSVQIQLLSADITAIKVDVIVNAANAELAGGGGVDGAIHEAGGPTIMVELDRIREQIGRCEPGGAVVTSAGRLPARLLFHAVGPIYRDGNHGEAQALRSCYRTCLDLALQHGLETISFPSISTGVYRYPKDQAAHLALETVADWIRDHPSGIKAIKLVQYSAQDHEMYRKTAEKLGWHVSVATHS